MKRRAIVLLLLGAAVFCPAQRRPAPNAFLDRRAHDMHEFIGQVENDQAVMDRFRRHFLMSGHEVIEFLESLHLEPLPRTAVFTVYSAPPSGIIKVHRERLTRGTVVCADVQGEPILVFSCGNPLVGPRPKPPVVVPPPPLPPPARVVPLPPVVVPPPPVIIRPPPPVVVPPPPPPPAPPILPPPPVGGVVNNSKSASPAWFLLVLPLIFINNHHSHSTTIVQKQPPVPEPASLIVLVVGAGFLIRRRKS